MKYQPTVQADCTFDMALGFILAFDRSSFSSVFFRHIYFQYGSLNYYNFKSPIFEEMIQCDPLWPNFFETSLQNKKHQFSDIAARWPSINSTGAMTRWAAPSMGSPEKKQIAKKYAGPFHDVFWFLGIYTSEDEHLKNKQFSELVWKMIVPNHCR